MERLVDSQTLQHLQTQIDNLEQVAAAAGTNKAARLEELGARVKRQLLKGGKIGRKEFLVWWNSGRPSTAEYCPALQLAARAIHLKDLAAKLLHIPTCSVDGVGMWDGRFEEDFSDIYYKMLLSWRPQAQQAEGIKSVDTTHILLPCETKEEYDVLKVAVEDAGALCVGVCRDGQLPWPDALPASVAAARYGGQAIGIAFADPICAPFLNAFPQAVFWHLKTLEASSLAWNCPEYQRLCALVDSLADVGVEEKQFGAKEFVALCAQNSRRKRDVMVLATIDYDFLRQRPQHLAQLAAQNEHRVFFINPNVSGDMPKQLLRDGNLRVVQMAAMEEGHQVLSSIYQMPSKEKDDFVLRQLQSIISCYGIRKPIIKVEYPLWAPAAVTLKDQGANIVFDFLDDYSGFSHENEEWMVDNCNLLVENAEAVVVTSNHLYQKATKAHKRYLIRNGVDAQHFADVPSMQKNRRQIVGYYGVVSDWFDYNKILALDNSPLNIEIQLVGVIQPVAQKTLANCKKVKLINACPYGDLPRVLAGFDVCLIPFDAQNPLIQATNPVKFYEYLAGGKKVVATKIPELIPYDGQYVLLEDEDEAFVQAVIACLEGRDGLAKLEDRKSFARENDWKCRAEEFEKVFANFG